jgi:predicted dehydrogenase
MIHPPIRLGIIGVGKIARDQHIPALHANADFAFVAAASRNANADEPGVEDFHDLDAMLASGLPLDAVSICTPPMGRYAIARAAIEAGKSVMLEKPPGATVSEVLDLADRARAKGVALFCSWHSRAAAGVEPARAWLAERRVTSARIDWREDVRRWHPGQEWVFEAGGLGVFDPGINALSIATRVLPGPLLLRAATLETPAGREGPIAAQLDLTCDGTAGVQATFDWRQTGPQTWDITVDTDGGALRLSEGGAKLSLDGAEQPIGLNAEYPGLYRRFAELVRRREVDADVRPLQLVADAFMLGRRHQVEAFVF